MALWGLVKGTSRPPLHSFKTIQSTSSMTVSHGYHDCIRKKGRFGGIVDAVCDTKGGAPFSHTIPEQTGPLLSIELYGHGGT